MWKAKAWLQNNNNMYLEKAEGVIREWMISIPKTALVSSKLVKVYLFFF
jgi:hypothetical protein